MPQDLRLIAGFDAGQTHTTCRLAALAPDGSFEILSNGDGTGVSHLAAPGGEHRFRTALTSSLSSALASANLPVDYKLVAAGIGASGIEVNSPVQFKGLQLAASELGLPEQQLVVLGDERTALHGAFPRSGGILLISGTGCIAIGRDDGDREHRCGGWGWLLDGHGSAMDIGRDALMLSVRMADGRNEDSHLRQRIWDALGISSAQALKARVVHANFGPASFAALAPCVNELALAGDADAQRIIQACAQELVSLVSGVARNLRLTSPRVAAVGGAIENLTALRSSFQEILATRLPQSRLVKPDHDACQGALLMAATSIANAHR